MTRGGLLNQARELFLAEIDYALCGKGYGSMDIGAGKLMVHELE